MSRRAKGSGSLRHLDTDRWQVVVKVGGRRVSRVFHAHNGTEAERASDAVRLELVADLEKRDDERGAEREQRQAWTVKQYAAHYMREWAPLRLSPTTQERYRQVIDKQIVPHLGTLRMSQVTAKDIARMHGTLAETTIRGGGTYSAATITKVHNVLGSVFTYAVDVLEDFESNPVHKKAAKPVISSEARKMRALDLPDAEQFVALARAEESAEVFAGIPLSVRLGLRRGEAVALCWRDVDFDKQEVTISRSVAQTPDGLTVKGTKTGKDRTVPIDDDLIADLRALKTAQAALRLASPASGPHAWKGGKTPADDFITAIPNGAVLEPEASTSRFRALAKRHKLKVNPHLLRHSFISQLIALDYDPTTIASMSGHSPDVLLRRYAHEFDRRKRGAIDALQTARRAAAGE